MTQFPIFKTKIENLTQKSRRKFNLADPKERAKYFKLKAGPEIKKLREYLKKNTFIAYLVGKKNSGKGTYSKMFAQVVEPAKIDHFSIGDMIRAVDKELRDKRRRKELILFLEKNYRGRLSLEKVIFLLENRDTKTLLPTELILTLVKREIFKREKKTIFIDGFPRELDQVSYSLFFRDLIGYRDDPDIFILIDIPESVISERIKWRRICPYCQTSRNLKLLPTSKIGYNQKNKEFYLICDEPECKGAKMVLKEGDELGIELIKERLKLDEKLLKQTFLFYGISKILLRNSIPIKEAKKFVDDYEITSEYDYQWDEKNKKVKIIEKPWVILDDEGTQSYSLLAPPVVVSLIKQLTEVLGL